VYEERDRVASVLRVGGVFKIAVIACQDQRVGGRIELLDEGLEELVEVLEEFARRGVDSAVSDLIRQKVLEQGEGMVLCH